MKSLSTTTLLIACLSTIALQTEAGAQTLYDLAENQIDGLPGFPETGDQYLAQPVITGSLGTISSIRLLMKRDDNPGGVLHVEIWDDENGQPGSLIANVGEIDFSSVSDSFPRTWITLDHPVAGLRPNTLHHVVVNFKDATFGTGGANTVRIYFSRQEPGGHPEVGSTRIQLTPGGLWVSVPTLFGSPAGEELRVIMSVSESGFEGFTNHEVAFSGRAYDLNNEVPPGAPLLLGSARVGDGVESEGRTIDLGGGVIFNAPTFDLDRDTIEIDMSHLAGNTTDPGNFNGYIIEDKNGTLPDFQTVSVDTASTTLIPSNILVSPNSIWIDVEEVTFAADSFMRLNVTFAETPSTRQLSLTPQSDGSMLFEAPATIGESYQFEQSEDLINFSPIDNELIAASPFVMTFFKPANSKMLYRLREVE